MLVDTMGGGTPTTKNSQDDYSHHSLESEWDGQLLPPPLPPSPASNSCDPLRNGELENPRVSKSADELFSTLRLRRRNRIYQEIMKDYDVSDQAYEITLQRAKEEILRYKPGSFIEEVGGLKRSNYEIPRTTTLLLIGPKGSGKSSLVNKISQVFEKNKFSSERAQVSYNLSKDGTYFLQEFMIPRDTTSFSLFDTRSLSEDSSENFKLLKNWMLGGVQHGRAVIRDSDSHTLRTVIKNKARRASNCYSEKRMVNFVIFVVDGVSVLKSMASEDSMRYTGMLSETFNCPYLSFKDDKPVVVVTHGDELALSDRVRIRIHLGELLGISPTTQIFDIPDQRDCVTEAAIVKMIRHSLEHADKNLPFEEMPTFVKTFEKEMMAVLAIIALVLVMFGLLATRASGRQKSEFQLDWPRIRHLW